MSNLIDRDAAIDAIEITPFDDYGDYMRAKELIEQLPSAQPQWIPVSERLPEDQTYVLVSTLDNDVQEAHLDGEGRFRDCYGDKVKCVIAWMSLPEPYKEGE